MSHLFVDNIIFDTPVQVTVEPLCEDGSDVLELVVWHGARSDDRNVDPRAGFYFEGNFLKIPKSCLYLQLPFFQPHENPLQ